MCRQSSSVCLIKVPTRQHRLTKSLGSRLQTLADPRHRRGKRHSFVSVVLVACSAVLTGARSFAAIGQWASNAPQDALARLGARTTSVFRVRIAPSTATIRRVLNSVCPGGLADLLGSDPTGADTLAVDGKSARGSRHGDIPAAHLLAAITGGGLTVTQLRVPDKTNEIACFEAREAQPEEPAPPTHRPALGEGEREVLRPHRRPRAPGDSSRAGADRQRTGRRLPPRGPGREDYPASHPAQER